MPYSAFKVVHLFGVVTMDFSGPSSKLAANRGVRLRTDRDACRGRFQTRPGATNTDREWAGRP